MAGTNPEFGNDRLDTRNDQLQRNAEATGAMPIYRAQQVEGQLKTGSALAQRVWVSEKTYYANRAGNPNQVAVDAFRSGIPVTKALPDQAAYANSPDARRNVTPGQEAFARGNDIRKTVYDSNIDAQRVNAPKKSI